MPRHLFQYHFICPHSGCQGTLVNNGVHQKTRMVLDIHDYYIIAGEDYECNKCKRRVISWSQSVLDQLDLTERSKFPCILTDRYACDLKVVRMMRQRTLGNSSSLVCKQIAENHGESYLDKCRQYATKFMAFKKSAAKGLVTIPAFVEPPPVMEIPRHRWFMKVYQLDVISRLDYELAELTSVTGDILKIDSTKKITNKLAGSSRGTAMWATNMGNEHGQVLMSVLTEGEGEGLKKMLDGIVSRYRNAGVPPPKVLYTDRDCCGRQCVKKFFDAWPFLHVKLDSWHFMRRFPNGCTTDKHQLYGPFMARLSRCIFKIDEDDYARLIRAKREELILQGVPHPSENDVIRRISPDEVGRHCKRATRGTKETTTLITELIASLDGERGLDTCGVPLIDSVKMSDIWSKQSQHVACLQDPPGVSLYVQVSTLKKGGIELPVYKCARGSTSLENFHLHMARFIPGTLAKDTNFQVYLLDGIFRWNADRAAEAVSSHNQAAVLPRTYSGPLKNQTNILWQELCGKPFFPNFKPPGNYTGELVGVQYLYNQTGQEFPALAQTIQQLEDDEDMSQPEADNQEDEGFVEMPQITPPEAMGELPEETAPTPPSETAPQPILHIPSEAEYRQMAMDTVEGLEPPVDPTTLASNVHVAPSLEDSTPGDQSSDVLGPDNVPGYDKVLNLAKFLVELRDERALREDKVQQLINLWEQLSDFDKKRTNFPRRYTKKPWSGKFGGRGKNVAPGVESITKVLLGPNQSPAQWPNCNRYTEATCELLLRIFPGDQKREGRIWTRWRLVLRAFHNIRQVVVKSQKAMQMTDIQLPLLNKKTLQQWYNKEDKEQEQKVLLQGINMPKPPVTASGLPEARQKPAVLPSSEAPRFTFKNPSCTAGLARKRTNSKRKTPVPEPSDSKKPALQTILPATPTVIRYPVIMEQQQLIVLNPGHHNLPSFSTSTPPTTTTTTIPSKTSRPYKTPSFIKCSKCGHNRKNSDTHKSFMFNIFCANSEPTTFEEWKTKTKQEMDEKRKLKKQHRDT
ncbi:uncharacterized protein LOC123530114 [Mercenaria mercenaria]|uniref:uncharacterized protein LOC123530114 n=1 Tax=Mercenaria mercenaria TaxID=6596 RepID=UPI00234E818F|nr:uncharacterized protein LOC123530114 [Mercenaria mercenaria]